MEPAAKTPLLHHKLEQLIAAEDLIPGSHDYKAVVALFESFPKDELFQASAEELRRLVAGLLQLEKHGGIRVLIRRDLYGRNVSVVVALPRDRFNADLRKRSPGPLPRALPRHDDRLPPLPGGDGVCAHLLHDPRRPWHADPRCALRGARAGGRDPCAHLGGRPPRRAHAARRRGSRARPDGGVRAAVPGLLQGQRRVGPGRRRRRDAREARGVDRGVPRRARQRVEGRTPDAGQALQDRRQGRSLGFHADPRSARASGRRGGADRDRGRGTGVRPRLRGARLTGRRAGARGSGGSRHGHDRGRVARGVRLGLAEPPRDVVDPHLVGDQDPPRAPELSDARLRPVHRELPERRDGGLPLDLGTARADVRSPFRSRACRHGRGDRRDPAGDPPATCAASPPSTRTTSCDTCSGRSRRSCGRTRTSPTGRS